MFKSIPLLLLQSYSVIHPFTTSGEKLVSALLWWQNNSQWYTLVWLVGFVAVDLSVLVDDAVAGESTGQMITFAHTYFTPSTRLKYCISHSRTDKENHSEWSWNIHSHKHNISQLKHSHCPLTYLKFFRVWTVAISRAIVCFLWTERKSESILITSKSQKMSGRPTLAFKLKASKVNMAASSKVCFSVCWIFSPLLFFLSFC